MTFLSKDVTFFGGCHCEAIRFLVKVHELLAIDCNCSICQKKGFIHLIVPPKQFTLLKGSDALMTYTFNTKVAKHHFCRICGIHPFYRPRSHPDSIDVNVRCLDGNALSRFTIKSFDGANWEENINQIL
ncbi:aldehyde-activating protein [Aphanothece hegewaldii CCALA 016]|uniref:Aldehyde-activating protein n=1 Tax=Aphanothece hegewaldii CCALA 016 TaxID=2107694 RepID=A0A2T1M215_9CHRO|nr:GFA family protein [Aphanothece hegewaldii]PSF38738.1 aldehyde-activating protein [Aphanothece hegewaldii CCALA 016]